MNGVRKRGQAAFSPGLLTHTEAPRKKLPVPISGRADSAQLQPRGALASVLSGALARLIPQGFEPLVGPPAGKPIKATGSLIGPGVEFPDPLRSFTENLASLKKSGVPRFPLLTPIERKHETAFANDVEENLEFFLEGARLAAHDEELGTMVFEPDGLKRLYAPYGTAEKPASPDERKVRAEANHALHPTATLLARLAFLERLDELQKLPADDPKRTVFVTSGGVAAGKGDMDETVKLQFGGFPFGAMWDSAGESDGLENAWVLQAAQARGLKTVFAYAANEPAEQYIRSLDRGQRTGRFVDVVTFAHSYVEGAKNLRALLESPEYLAAKKAGTATTLAMHMGEYDKRAEADSRFPHYPHARLLGEQGLIEASDVPQMPEVPALVASAIGTLEAEAARVKERGGDVQGLLTGALGNAEKFARSGLLEKA